MGKLADKTSFVKQTTFDDYPNENKNMSVWEDDWEKDQEMSIPDWHGSNKGQEDASSDDAELTPQVPDRINNVAFDTFPDDFIIINDIFLTGIPTNSIKMQSTTDVFVGETLRTSAPVISSEGRDDFILSLSFSFPPGEEQSIKLRRLMAEITKHPLVFIHNNRIKKALNVDEFETTMFILESGNLRSTMDTVGLIILDLQLYYFNYKPFSNNFYFNSNVRGINRPENENIEQVDMPISLSDMRGHKGQDYSMSIFTEKIKNDVRSGALSVNINNGENTPTNLPVDSEAWMYYADHLESLTQPVSEIPSDYIGFVLREYQYFQPPGEAQDSPGTLKNFQLQYADPQQVYDATRSDNSLKTAQERNLEALINIPDVDQRMNNDSLATYQFRNRIVQVDENTALWLCRMIIGEGGYNCPDEKAKALCWAILNRFMYRRAYYGTLTNLIQQFSQPLNPRWIPGGSKWEEWYAIERRRLAKNPKYKIKYTRPSQAKRRNKMFTLSWDKIPKRIRNIVNNFRRGRLFAPDKLKTINRPRITNWASHAGLSKKYPWGITFESAKHRGNPDWFFEDNGLYNGKLTVTAPANPNADLRDPVKAEETPAYFVPENELAKKAEHEAWLKKLKAQGNQKNTPPDPKTPSEIKRRQWINGMANTGWHYYLDDPNVRNVFFRDLKADISSDYVLHRQGTVFPNIVCVALSVNFGHRIAPMRLLSQSSSTYQFLGAGNKSGQMVLLFSGEQGKQSADELKRMFSVAKTNARVFSSMIKEVGSIGLISEFHHTGESNTILSLLGAENIVVTRIEESSLPDSVDKHQLIIEFIVQEFAEEKYEKKLIKSLDNKKAIIKSIMSRLKVRESKQFDNPNVKRYFIRPSREIAIRDQRHERPYTVTKNTPAWMADIVVRAAEICQKFDEKMPPLNWKLEKESSKTWYDIYKQWGAHDVFHGRIENIDRTETNWTSGSMNLATKAQTNRWLQKNPGKTEAEAIETILGENRSFYDGNFKKNGYPETNETHGEIYEDWLQQMELLARYARRFIVDEKNFKYYFGSVGTDMLKAVTHSLGECYEDMLLPPIPLTQGSDSTIKIPFAPEFYVYDDSHENPTLSNLSDKENMITFLKDHVRNERESIQLHMRDRYLGGSYISKNLPKILENRKAYDKNFQKEYSFMDNFAKMLSEGTKVWEPIYYRGDTDVENSEGVNLWRNKVQSGLGSKSDEKARLQFMDNLLQLSPYLKNGNQWQTPYGSSDTNTKDLIKSIYGDAYNNIAFGPNKQYSVVDAITSGKALPPNPLEQKEREADITEKVNKLSGTMTKLSDGTIVVGQTEQEKESSERSVLGEAKEWVYDAVDTVTDNSVTSFILGPYGQAIHLMKQGRNVVQATQRTYNNIDIKNSLDQLDHPDKEKLSNLDPEKEIATFATNNAIGSKSDDISIRRVYPTFKIYFIEDDFEDTEKIDGQVIRAYDDFYSSSSIQEIRIIRSRKIASDLAIIRMTNIGGLLLRKRFGETDPTQPAHQVNQERQGIFADTEEEHPFARMVLQDGVKVQIRLGYNSDPDQLETVFLGQIVEIAPAENGKILEIMCQGYGAELEAVELGPLEDGPVFYSTQQALSAAIIQDSIVNFGRQSKFNRFNPAEIRNAWTGGKGYSQFQKINPLNIIGSWADNKMDKLLNKYTFLNYPQDDNIYAPPPDTYATGWDTFWNNACVYRPLKQTTWQIFKEHELRHPSYISLAVPYGHSPRMTMFFGGKLQHYWSRPPSSLEIYLTENAHNSIIRMRGMALEDGGDNKFLEKINTLAEESPELTGAVLEDILSTGAPNRTATAISKQFGRYKPFRNYHYFDSEHHILQNEIRTSVDGTFNEVELLYFDNENDITDSDGEDVLDSIQSMRAEQEGFLSLKLDENIPESSLRCYRNEFPSCVTDGMARRYAQGIFAKYLRDSYKGEFCVIGKETIKPYDVCVSGNTLIDTLIGPKQIKDIKIGDSVLTHNCRYRKVLQLFKRKPTEKVYRVSCKTSIDNEDLIITANHPVFALKRKKVLYGGQIQRLKMWNNINPDFISVSELSIGDYLVIPREIDGKHLNESFAKLLGFYLAEGSIIWEYRKSNKIGRQGNKSKQYSLLKKKIRVPVAIKLSFNLKEEIHLINQINELTNNCCGKNIRVYKNPDKNELDIRIYDRSLTNKILKHAGFSDNKDNKHNKWLRNKYNLETSIHIIGCYLSGDGCQTTIPDRKRSEYKATSTSYNLLRSVYRTLVDIGIPATFEKTFMSSGYSKGKYCYSSRIPKKFINLFSDYAKRFTNTEKPKSSNTIKFIKNNYCYIPIKNIEEIQYNKHVYNIEVEEDNSYIANNKIVHNCYINDSTINMTGPIEVEAVTHIFNRDSGFVSVITPDLCVEINDMFTASVFDVAGAGMAWSWGWGDIAAHALPGASMALNAVKGVSFLALAAGAKFASWTQDGAPVVTSPLTLGGKPFTSVSLGSNNTSLIFNLHGKWRQYWDDFDDAWRKFDLAEAIFDSRVGLAEKTYSLLGTGREGQ